MACRSIQGLAWTGHMSHRSPACRKGCSALPVARHSCSLVQSTCTDAQGRGGAKSRLRDGTCGGRCAGGAKPTIVDLANPNPSSKATHLRFMGLATLRRSASSAAASQASGDIPPILPIRELAGESRTVCHSGPILVFGWSVGLGLRRLARARIPQPVGRPIPPAQQCRRPLPVAGGHGKRCEQKDGRRPGGTARMRHSERRGCHMGSALHS